MLERWGVLPKERKDKVNESKFPIENDSDFSMLDNIMHQKVQGVNQIPRPKDVWMNSLNDFTCSLTVCCIISDYLNHIRRTNIISCFQEETEMFWEDAMIEEESCAARNTAPVAETPRTLIKCWFLTFVQPSDTMNTL